MRIGTKVKAKYAYAKKASDRFKTKFHALDTEYILTSKVENFTGYIVGERWQIMSNFKHHWEGTDEQSYVTGTKEKVLLVVKSKWNNPLVVRFTDIII